MNMSIRPFDTHEYVQELIRGGFSPQLAEANMHALVKALDFTIEHQLVTQREFQDIILNLDKFATKEELQALYEELKKVILKLEEFEARYATKEELQAVKEELQRSISKLEKEISQLEHRLDRKIQYLAHKIDKVFLKTMVSTGSMIAIGCTVLGFLIKS